MYRIQKGRQIEWHTTLALARKQFREIEPGLMYTVYLDEVTIPPGREAMAEILNGRDADRTVFSCVRLDRKEPRTAGGGLFRGLGDV